MNATLELTKHPANPEQSAALSAITELLAAHHADAEDSADEDGKFSIAFKVTFDRSYNPTKLKVTSRISQSITDEPLGAGEPGEDCRRQPEGRDERERASQIETTIDDPRQPKLL
jgi:hypothetical protein